MNNRNVTAPWEKHNESASQGRRILSSGSTQAPWTKGSKSETKFSRKMIKPAQRLQRVGGKKIIGLKPTPKPTYIRGKKIVQHASRPSSRHGGRKMVPQKSENYNILNNKPSPIPKVSKSFRADMVSKLGVGVVPNIQEAPRSRPFSARRNVTHFKGMLPTSERANPKKGSIQDRNKTDHLSGAPNSDKKPTNHPNADFPLRLRKTNLSKLLR